MRYKCALPPDEWAHVCFTWETTEQEARGSAWDDPPRGPNTAARGVARLHIAAVAVAAGICERHRADIAVRAGHEALRQRVSAHSKTTNTCY